MIFPNGRDHYSVSLELESFLYMLRQGASENYLLTVGSMRYVETVKLNMKNIAIRMWCLLPFPWRSTQQVQKSIAFMIMDKDTKFKFLVKNMCREVSSFLIKASDKGRATLYN